MRQQTHERVRQLNHQRSLWRQLSWRPRCRRSSCIDTLRASGTHMHEHMGACRRRVGVGVVAAAAAATATAAAHGRMAPSATTTTSTTTTATTSVGSRSSSTWGAWRRQRSARVSVRRERSYDTTLATAAPAFALLAPRVALPALKLQLQHELKPEHKQAPTPPSACATISIDATARLLALILMLCVCVPKFNSEGNTLWIFILELPWEVAVHQVLDEHLHATECVKANTARPHAGMST